ncbi:lipid-A-disaccharide synthase [Arsenophonus sp.]|uniref:lipid-A-disaccharide synthase n=1 Tax=Arsenophonus sp. TaxID=1872640 RepID=UPI00285E0F2C|nr:lipid-A-disaccharide synthase [Arsenophonus sp.]MDR5617804.1 lipid-A-disaccharide synthase [Arsenophonus sp.]
MQEKPLIIGLVAGEKSGDILGAGLMRALKQKLPNTYFVGVAGSLMQAEGCKTWYAMEELAVMGFVEVFGNLARLLKIRVDLIKRFIKLQPDVFIGIDAPDFNITIEEKLKQRGIKTIHYVSPSIWAWRKNRIFKIERSIDLILTLLPFEKKFYDIYNIPCRFIGHTLADMIPLKPNKQAAREHFNINYNTKCLAILPGSRYSEIKMLSAIFLRAAQILLTEFPNLQILVPIVNEKLMKQFKMIYQKKFFTLPLKIFYSNQAHIIMMAADVTLLASGTASLECMLAKCPMVVGYKVKFLTYWIAKQLIKIPFISLPNLLAGEELVKEFVQQDCKPEPLAKALSSLLFDKNKVVQLKNKFMRLHKSIRCHADYQAAEAVLELSKK